MKSTLSSKSFSMKQHKRTGLVLLVSLTLAQMSCLKDSPNNASPIGGSNNVVEFQNSNIPVSYTSIFPQYDNGIALKNDTGSFPVNLDYTGQVSVAPQDIKINLAVLDSATLDSFNTDQGTGYELPPTDAYSLATSATIVKGTRQVTVRVLVNTGAPDFDYTKSYALPLKITSASYGVISSNFGTAVYSFTPLNKYDGSYSLTEKLSGWGAYTIADGISYAWPNNIGFVTAGQYSNSTFDKNDGSLQLAFAAGGGTTAFGATTPQFTFDATDKLVAVTNTTPDDGRGRKLAIDPAVTDSRYDNASKTIYAAYIMYQNGRPNQYIRDTLVYQGPR